MDYFRSFQFVTNGIAGIASLFLAGLILHVQRKRVDKESFFSYRIAFIILFVSLATSRFINAIVFIPPVLALDLDLSSVGNIFVLLATVYAAYVYNKSMKDLLVAPGVNAYKNMLTEYTIMEKQLTKNAEIVARSKEELINLKNEIEILLRRLDNESE